ncbi:MAG: DUF6305 family protein [Calditrichia bacterium]
MYHFAKRNFLSLWIIIWVLLIVLTVGAQEKAEFRAQEPALITSAGQSADVLMVKLLADKAGIHFLFDKTASAEMVDSVQSVILVCGGSSKGLGAARIDKEDELNRVKSILAAAKKQKKQIIAIHVGGKSRRGKLSDFFNQPVAEAVNIMIVVKEGDHDNFFSQIAAEKKIPIRIPDKIVTVQEILKEIYGK